MKKILSILTVLVMLFAMTAPAFAEETTTYTIELTTAADGTALTHHTYNVYQIFTGDLFIDDNDTPEVDSDDETILSNVKYGKNYGTQNVEVPADVMEDFMEMTGVEAAAKLNSKKTGDPYAVLNSENNWKITKVPAGYYLIVDVSENLPEGETSSALILQVVENTTVASKHTSGPIVEKKIDDTNDSVDATDATNWQDSADHDIGDKIPFQLKMTVPADFYLFVENEEPYPFTFHDTEEAGLSFNNDAKVYVDGKPITTGYEVITPAPATEDHPTAHTFDVVFANLTAIPGVNVGSKITVEYTSTLNENAILGNQGNVNEVFGEFRNYYEPETPVYTPKDTVIAFTYKVVVNKVDKDEKPLIGAEFTLEKYDAATNKWVAIDQVKTTSGTTFTFTGLDDGKYRLTETATPDGYNTIKPVEFTVTAKHEITWTTGIETRTTVLTSLEGSDQATVETGKLTFTADKDNGTLTTDVVNNKGTVLPETGAMGTTLFVTFGSLAVFTAVVFLVTRKKMSVYED